MLRMLVARALQLRSLAAPEVKLSSRERPWPFTSRLRRSPVTMTFLYRQVGQMHCRRRAIVSVIQPAVRAFERTVFATSIAETRLPDVDSHSGKCR